MDFQGTLFDTDRMVVPDLDGIERTALTRGAWVDVLRNWMPAADEVFTALVHDVPWRAERRQMYDRVVDVPRLVHTYAVGEALPHDALVEARTRLSAHYLPELGEEFVTAGCCYYRDGRDSVAWHGDTIGRGRTQDTMVAIVSFGDPRRLALRPKREAASVGQTHDDRNRAAELRGRQTEERERAGGESLSVVMGHGDVVVMGGSCQRTWEHAVPKVAGAGPRVSVQFRPLNVF